MCSNLLPMSSPLRSCWVCCQVWEGLALDTKANQLVAAISSHGAHPGVTVAQVTVVHDLAVLQANQQTADMHAIPDCLSGSIISACTCKANGTCSSSYSCCNMLPAVPSKFGMPLLQVNNM